MRRVSTASRNGCESVQIALSNRVRHRRVAGGPITLQAASGSGKISSNCNSGPVISPLAAAGLAALGLINGLQLTYAPVAAAAATAASAAADPAALEVQHQQLQLQGSTAVTTAPPLTSVIPANNSSSNSLATAGPAAQGASSSSSGLPAIYQRLPPLPDSFPELPAIPAPDIQQHQLPNGLRVFLLEDREVPLVRGSLIMLGGQVSSPPDKVGLASIAAGVQRSGGSRSHPGPAMDERLEDLAASIEASAGQQSMTFDFDCMAADTSEVLQLLAELVQQPALPEDRLVLLKGQVDNVIRHRDDNAAAVARRELYKLLYGAHSIYTRTPTHSGVASITTDDLARHIATWQRPDAALLGLVGDFSSPDMLATVTQVFGSWAAAPGQPQLPPSRPRDDLQDLPAIAALQQQQQQQGLEQQQQEQQQPELVYLIDRPGAEQASVAVGEPGVSLSDPETFALDVLSSYFNGFGGLLFDGLRTRQGLAYSVAASWDSPADHRGLFVAAAETVQPGRFLQELSRLLGEARVTPLTAAELARARANLLNSFVFNFASSASQLQRSLVYQLLGLPQDFLFRYRDNVQGVTPAAVVAAAAQHLHPRQQVVVVVGDAAGLTPQLQAAGFRVQPLALTPAD